MHSKRGMALGTVLLTAAAMALAGCGANIDTATSENTYTITEPVTSLQIDNPVGTTQIEGTDATTVSVVEQIRYTSTPAQTRHAITDGELTLSYTCPSGVDNVTINVNGCSVSYLVKVPRRIAVQIDSQAGVVTLTGLAGQLAVTSSTGSVNASELTSATVTARATAGAITLDFATPPNTVDAQAQVGAVTVLLPAGNTYAVDAGSQVGNVEVTVQRDPVSMHRVAAQSQVGSVTVSNS